MNSKKMSDVCYENIFEIQHCLNKTENKSFLHKNIVHIHTHLM